MNTPDTAALWQIRKAVKPWLENNSQLILFGCSGGADSMALALALFIESENKNVIPIVVDHGLQPESAQVTLDTIEKLKKIGYKQIETAKAQVIITDGLEASARRARYQIFNQFIDAYDAKYFLLAHTLNDQAENVLLGLARGSGTRSLSGMANEIFKHVEKLNLEVGDLERLPKAIRPRVLRLAIYNAGSPIGSLTADHIGSVESLVSDWHGQKEVALPGNVKVFRNSGRIILSNQ